ncbi:uncharacterized protein [Malus domestica]|uniref:uncharacterized protein n=1 Tax=Malus domestica TaxID=3750 RepID=UPI0039769BC0
MPPATGGKGMMIVATDYFTKWVETEPMTTATQTDIEHFIWRNIICQFGIPLSIVTDNCPQFVGKDLAKFFQKYGIKQHMSMPRYPQGNGQAEASNKTILECLKDSSPIRRENGQTNSPDVPGHIAPPKNEQPVKLISPWHLV